MVMRVLALTKKVEPSLPLSQRMRATSRQLPAPMFLFCGIQRKVKRPLSRTCRCVTGAELCALRTKNRTVREQNSITGQPRPRTVWMSVVAIVLGLALMICAALAAAGAAAATHARRAAMRAVVRRTWTIFPRPLGGEALFLSISQGKRLTLPKVAVGRLAWRCLPARCAARVGERARRVPADLTALAALRVAG